MRRASETLEMKSSTSSTVSIMDLKYKKRSGTSGISGHLYETKLISLLSHRLERDKRVEYFYLATNVYGMGAFDDICLVIKLVEHPRLLSLFIQIKHKDNDEAILTLDHKTDLIKWFESFLKIRKNIASRTFCLNITEADCLFIIYTNAGFDIDVNTTFESNYASVLNSLIATSSTVGCRPLCSHRHIEDCGQFFLRRDLETLVDHFVTFLNNKTNQSMHMMNDEYILQYHVILTQKVVEVSDIQTDKHEPNLKWRILTFRRNFFDTKDKDFEFFRDTLFQEVLRKYPSIRSKNKQTVKSAQDLSTDHPTTDQLISSFLDNPSAATLSPLIITHITCNETDKLEFLTKRPLGDVEQLKTITISRHAIDKAYYSAKMAAIEYLQTLQLHVPIAFGNVDLALSGSEKKIERRLKHITNAIVNLCKECKQIGLYKIVTIDDAVDNGLLSTNGGLSSAVGNILVYDKPTNFLKFSKDFTSSQNNAHSLFERLATEISNLHDYRFDVKTTKFPKIQLHCGSVVNEFLNQLIIYPKQSNHYNVERIFKKEIRDHLNVNPLHSVIKTDSVFLYYHENILKWWMLPKMNSFITKTSRIYENTINGLVAEQCISKLHAIFCMSSLTYFGFSFNENATKWMELSELPSKMFITTSTVTLTTMKVLQCLRSHYRINTYAVLDLEHVFKLSVADTLSLKAELERMKNPVIFVCREKEIRNKSDLLNEIIETMRNTTSIIITDDIFIKDYFLNTFSTFHDGTQCLTALTPESQREIKRKAEVIVQDKKVSLDLLLDNHSVKFIKGYLLDIIIHKEVLNIGTPLDRKSSRYVKSFYIDRRISLIRDSSDNICEKVTLVRTFYDIKDDIVLVTAAPGMGKSTLLTHLSLETQQCEEMVWIVRVNFLDHSNTFYKWHKNKIVVCPSESLKFLCQVALSISNISFNVKIENDEAHLVDFIGDESANFALNIFLIFYNKRKLIFVFDGFDEICPDYKNKVIDFLNIARHKLRKKKMWVTSRPYSDILPDLKKVFNKCFKLEHLNNEEQESYLIKYWKQDEMTQRLKFMHSTTLLGIVENMEQTMLISHNWIIKVFCIFYNFVHRYLSRQLGGDEVLQDLSVRFARRYNNQQQTETETLTGIPLLLHLIATQFIKMILSRVVLNRYNIYQMFIKSKIYEVLNKEKNKMDLSNPNIMMKCKIELNECMSSNKKLAAYALLREPIFRELKFEEFIDMDPLNETDTVQFNTMLNDVKTGADKIGLLSHVTPDNVPVFIHRSFTEYFAAEYVCDVIKSEKFSLEKKILWLIAISECCNRGVLDWVDLKIKIDQDLLHFIREMENMEPQALCNTSYRAYLDQEQLPKSHFIRIISSTVEDYESGCFDKYINIINEDLEQDDEQNLRNEFTRDIIKNMKPHIKKHFLPDCT